MIYKPIRDSILIVPNEVHDEINRRLDEEIAKHPGAAEDREWLYNCLLGAFYEFGYIPPFGLSKKPEDAVTHGRSGSAG
jgi:hypothetical protein